MKHNLKKPCNDCPFRRESQPGWLGNANPEWFVSSALADEMTDESNRDVYAAPCHKTIDYSDVDWTNGLSDAEVCVGSFVFYRNVDQFKLPRQPERSELVVLVKPDHDDVFSTVEEFINHHEGDRSMRSWVYGEGGQHG